MQTALIACFKGTAQPGTAGKSVVIKEHIFMGSEPCSRALRCDKPLPTHLGPGPSLSAFRPLWGLTRWYCVSTAQSGAPFCNQEAWMGLVMVLKATTRGLTATTG